MATEEQHLARAASNEAFARGISPIQNGGWKVITTFYAALHYVEAIIVRSGLQSSDHKSRGVHMRNLPELQLVSSDYQTLSNYAWIARYDPTIDLSRERVTQEICDLLGPIKTQLGY